MAVRPGEVIESVVGYVTLPVGGPGGEDDGAALIEAAVERRHWRLLEIVRERDTSGRSLDRPGLSYALEKVGAGEAGALIVSDLRNLCRSIVDLASLVQWFRERQASLIALDLGLDTGTADGQTVADVLITLAAWEHDRIADRTRKGLANAKARGDSVGRRAVSDTPELARPDRRHARGQHDALCDRRHAKRRGHRDHARWISVAALERAGRPRLQAPAHGPAADALHGLVPKGPVRRSRRGTRHFSTTSYPPTSVLGRGYAGGS